MNFPSFSRAKTPRIHSLVTDGAQNTSDLSRSQAETLRKCQNGVTIEQYFQSHLLYKDSIALNKTEHGTGVC